MHFMQDQIADGHDGPRAGSRPGPADLQHYRRHAGWLASPDVVMVARTLCETRPASRCGFLCGSWVQGNARPGSDVDLYIVADSGPSFVREQLFFRGYPFQINTLTLDAAFSAIADGRAMGSAFYVHAFAHSGHVHGDRSAHALLGDVAARALAAGPLPYPATRVEVARVATVNTWIKLATTSDGERLLVAMRLFQNLLRYLQMSNGCWLFDDHWVARDAAFPADTLRRMTAAMAAAAAGTPDEFLDLVAELLGDKFLWATGQPVQHRRAF